MTVKEIAEICGVSEQAIRTYCIKHNVAKSKGKRGQPSFVIDCELEKAIISYYQNKANNDNTQFQNAISQAGSAISQFQNTISQDVVNSLKQQVEDLTAQHETKDSQLIEKQIQIDDLKKQIQTLTEQLAVKDSKLTEKDNQLDDLRKTIDIISAQLTAKDNQIQALQQTVLSLSDSLAVTNTALTQAQTLHALTIKADSETADTVEPTVTEQSEQQQQEKKRGFFSKFKKNK